MNYTDLEPVIHWQRRHRKVQFRCPRCDKWFDIPKDVEIDANGYCDSNIYHFCDDIYNDSENKDGWAVWAHLLEYEQ